MFVLQCSMAGGPRGEDLDLGGCVSPPGKLLKIFMALRCMQVCIDWDMS